MSRKSTADDPRVLAFAEAAERFCRVIERRSRVTKREFVHQCSRAIPELLLHFAPLYEVRIGRQARNRACACRKEKITHEQWQRLFRSVATKLGKDNGYYEVFNPYVVEQNDPVYTSLSDDLADIYRDLKEGLQWYGRRDEPNVQAAVYLWRLNMHVHAADHCVSAMRPIRQLIQNYHENGWF